MEGINHLFADVRNNNASNVFNVIGGSDNAGQSVINPMFFSTSNTYGALQAISANNNINANAYGAERVEIKNLPTTDFGTTLRGIKLPPFFGLVRVYGVYEQSELDALNANFNGSAFESDRETQKGALTLTNLLRKDADSYTVYIQKGGGDTLTGKSDSHTYILTEHAIDISRITGYTTAKKFSDYNYVVECVVFGFGKGFINKNNFVLSRTYSGDGADISANPAHLSQVPMVFPYAVDGTETVYVSGSRTVYQGDPFYTIKGSSVEISDSPLRVGQVLASDSYVFNDSRDQLDANGDSAIEIPNRRTYEVLASLDFYTTLGSGAIGGTVKRNTINDVGYSSGAGVIPSTANDAIPQNKVGLFTSLNKEISKAQATLVLFNAHVDKYQNQGQNPTRLLTITITDDKTYTDISFTGTVASALLYAKEIRDLFFAKGLIVDVIDNGDSVGLVFNSNLNGEDGNISTISVEIVQPGIGGADPTLDAIRLCRLNSGYKLTDEYSNWTSNTTKVNFSGGASTPNNAGLGNIDISLVGLTSRLPLGKLISDHDFLCEDPLRNESTSLQTLSSRLTSLPSNVGVSPTGKPYTKIVGSTGELLQMGDGDVEAWAAYNATTQLTGTKKYRVYRGGGSVFGASGDVPGAPLSWLNDSFGAESLPILKGGVLSCRAMLVRNFKEVAFAGDPSTRSYGDEVQMFIVTQGIFKDPNNKNIRIAGETSPSGFGEGYASADRYRIKGRPLVKGNSPDISDVSPAEYNK